MSATRSKRTAPDPPVPVAAKRKAPSKALVTYQAPSFLRARVTEMQNNSTGVVCVFVLPHDTVDCCCAQGQKTYINEMKRDFRVATTLLRWLPMTVCYVLGDGRGR